MGGGVHCLKALGFVLAGTAGWLLEAGGGEVRVSNQSLRETITVTQLVERGGKEDVRIALLTDLDDGANAGASRALNPGATARIFLREPPAEQKEPEVRAFKVTLEGYPAEIYFACRFSHEKGQPTGVAEFDPGLDPRLDLVQPEPGELVFCRQPAAVTRPYFTRALANTKVTCPLAAGTSFSRAATVSG